MTSDNDNAINPESAHETEGVEASVVTHGAQWSGTAAGRFWAGPWDDDVQIHLEQGKIYETDASVSVWLDPTQARKIADAIRTHGEGTWRTDSCAMWLDRGWLYSEAPSRHDSDYDATVSVLNDGELVELLCVYEDGVDERSLRMSTILSDNEQQTLVTALEIATAKANDYEVSGTEPSNDEKSFLRRLIS